jgi:hypothetical protein
LGIISAMSTAVHGSCIVCGHFDSRALSTTRLANGEIVVVCGTHELMHRRAENPAKTVADLRRMLTERRRGSRRGIEGDELGMRLSEAFASSDRRASSGADRRH